jgi:hypothetical protein
MTCFTDTIRARIHDIGLENIAKLIDRPDSLTDGEYIDLACESVSRRFGGYSISHVRGRYKAGKLLTREEAGLYLSEDKNYLVVETTAAVRFIIPCQTGLKSFANDFDSIMAAIAEPEEFDPFLIETEVKEIRGLFFQFFIEAVVATIKGEEEIWLLETGDTMRVYRWTRSESIGN